MNTQQRAKPACQQDINTKFYLLLAQLPRTQFTHSNAPTRMPGRHQRKIFASPIGTATPNAIYTQQRAKPEWQEDINAKFSHLPLAQLPRKHLHTATRQTRMPGRRQRKIFASPIGTATPRRQRKIFASPIGTATPNAIYTATRQTRMPGRHQHKIFASPIGTATPNAIYTQQRAKPGCKEDINAKFSHLLLAQLPPNAI